MNKKSAAFSRPKEPFYDCCPSAKTLQEDKVVCKNVRAKGEGSGEKKAVKTRHILDVEDRTRGGNAPVDWILISFG